MPRGFLLLCACLCAQLPRPLLGVARAEEPPRLGTRGGPRLLNHDVVSVAFPYPHPQNHTVLFLPAGSSEVTVGGTDFVVVLDTNDLSKKMEFRLECQETSDCENTIKAIEIYDNGLFVCGTNGGQPKCWSLDQTEGIGQTQDGWGISPASPDNRSLTVVVDGDLYAATAEATKDPVQFRRKPGGRRHVWMKAELGGLSWFKDPTFISLFLVPRREDPENEKIFMLFREQNSDPSLEADPWISRIGRVCKTDEGGPKRRLQSVWTSFLKARLSCGFPEESMYYNFLLDAYVLHDPDDWRKTRVYGLFSSRWNSTAVCIYSAAMMEDLFLTSAYRGYNRTVPDPRPGTCVPNSKLLSSEVLGVVERHPEMSDLLFPLQSGAPFYTSRNTFTKIVVDRVQTVDQGTYNVLLLATDDGKIHKILEAESEPLVISETQLPGESSVQSMKVDSEKKRLIVGFSERILSLDLQDCQDYNASCGECVLARDPYCAWTSSGCTATASGSIQNVADGRTTACPSPSEGQTEDEPEAVLSVPLGASVYLSCPIDSYHAEYAWEHEGGSEQPCVQVNSDCLHLIPAVTPEHYGTYRCVSTENSYTRVLRKYQLLAPVTLVPTTAASETTTPIDENIPIDAKTPTAAKTPIDTKFRCNSVWRNAASCAVLHTLVWILGLVVALVAC